MLAGDEPCEIAGEVSRGRSIEGPEEVLQRGMDLVDGLDVEGALRHPRAALAGKRVARDAVGAGVDGEGRIAVGAQHRVATQTRVEGGVETGRRMGLQPPGPPRAGAVGHRRHRDPPAARPRPRPPGPGRRARGRACPGRRPTPSRSARRSNRFVEIGSGTELAREVAKRGIRTPRGNRIDKKYIYRMLSNRAYIGEAVHKGESYPGEHDAIIDPEIWDKVHVILQESPRKRAARTRAETPALLKGLLFGPDGAAFSPTHTRKGGKLYRYYVSQTVLKHGAGSCPVGRVPAGEIEAAVIDQLRAVFRQPEIVAGTWKAARANADDITEGDARAALQQLDPLWDELFPAEQARIVALLIERVDIGTDGLNVRLRVDGLSGLAREMLAGGIVAAA